MIFVILAGPYRNKWSGHAPLYLVRDSTGIIRTVFSGQKMHDGIMHPTLRDARGYLRDNGFVLNKSSKGEN